jgi:phosphoribosylglycinamide formyltransferase-1
LSLPHRRGLVSGAGSLLQALIDTAAQPGYPADVVAVGSDRHDIEGLARAERAGIPTFTHRLKDYPDRAAWDRDSTASCAAHQPDLMISADRYLNTHPALLPAFPGMHAPRDALEHGVKIAGCTLFVVYAGIDSGRILAQRAVEVRPDDDETSLHERIKTQERQMVIDTIRDLVRHGIQWQDRTATQ